MADTLTPVRREDGFTTLTWSFKATALGAATAQTNRPVYGTLIDSYIKSSDLNDSLECHVHPLVSFSDGAALQVSATDVCGGTLDATDTTLTRTQFEARVASHLDLVVSGATDGAGAGANVRMVLVFTDQSFGA